MFILYCYDCYHIILNRLLFILVVLSHHAIVVWELGQMHIFAEVCIEYD